MSKSSHAEKDLEAQLFQIAIAFGVKVQGQALLAIAVLPQIKLPYYLFGAVLLDVAVRLLQQANIPYTGIEKLMQVKLETIQHPSSEASILDSLPTDVAN